MAKLILIVSTLFLFGTPSVYAMESMTNPTYYIFNLTYDGSALTQTNPSAAVPYDYDFSNDPGVLSGESTGQVYDLNNQLLTDFQYTLTTGDNQIFIPFYNNAGRIILKNSSGQQIYQYDISEIATCKPDKKCDASFGENYTTCPSDCKAPVVANNNSNRNLGILLLLVAAAATIVMTAVGIYFWRKERNPTNN